MVKHRSALLAGVVLLTVMIGCMPPVRTLSFDVDSPAEKYQYKWSSRNEEYLQRLCSTYQLDTLLVGSKNDLEKIQAVAHWVHGLWKHSDQVPSQYDAISIIEEAKLGKRFSCLEYAYVNTQCLNSLGYTARVTGLMTEDCETRSSGAVHVVTEVYLSDLKKWMAIDAQWDTFVTLDGTPLNCLQIQFAISQNLPGIDVVSLSGTGKRKYLAWLGPYLYYFQVFVDNRYAAKDRSREQILLYPIGAIQPQVFQGREPLLNTAYTHVVKSIYTRPE